jgi:hypothetical protein
MKKTIMAFALALSTGIASAQQPAVMVSTTPGWHKIASTTVDFKKERDEVMVLGADHFSAIKFMVVDAPIDLQDLEIWYENGTKQDVQVRTPIEVGKESRVINVDGGHRDIDKIVFVYKTLPNRTDERAEVAIYGLKPETTASDENMDVDRDRNVDVTDRDKNVTTTDRDRNAAGTDRDKNVTATDRDRNAVATDRDKNVTATDRDRNAVVTDRDRMDRDRTAERKDKDVGRSQDKNTEIGKAVPAPKLEVNDKTGWHKIGEMVVSFAKERDEIAVLGADRFAKLKFKVTDAGIMISAMTISYEDGTKQDVPVALTFNAGQESRVIDIPGAEKDIARISFVYKTIGNQAKDKAHLEIWGLKTNADKSTGMK